MDADAPDDRSTRGNMPEMSNLTSYLQEHRSRFLNEFVDLLRIPSISALPEHAADVQRAAEWVASRLTTAGIERVQILPTGGHPVVYGEWLHAPGKPTILIYGHFDVQPVDPVDQWTSPPFEPTIRGDRMYARGASDMKGNLLMPIIAAEALLRTRGSLPVNLKFFLEGQEEIGSPQIPSFLREQRDRFAGDLVISADGGQYSDDQPALSISCRGLAGVQIDVRGAQTDLHSGMYGGVVPNAIHALVEILGSMRSADGTIRIEGFYDDVIPLSEADRAQIAAAPFDEAQYKRDAGVDTLVGEPGYTPMERVGGRPSLDVNGIWGGFEGAGIKTVLPHEAHAKITCRLVANQDPDRIIELIAAHVAVHTPAGVTATTTPLPGKARPYLMPADHPGNAAARAVLEELYGKTPHVIRGGATIPVMDLFLTTLGAHTVTFGFGLPDEHYHAPDEFFRLASFERGQTAYCILLDRLGAR